MYPVLRLKQMLTLSCSCQYLYKDFPRLFSVSNFSIFTSFTFCTFRIIFPYRLFFSSGLFLLHYSFLLCCNFPDLFQIPSWTILFCQEIIILVQRTLRSTYSLFRIFLYPCFTLKPWKLPIYTSVCNYAGKTNDVCTLEIMNLFDLIV